MHCNAYKLLSSSSSIGILLYTHADRHTLEDSSFQQFIVSLVHSLCLKKKFKMLSDLIKHFVYRYT